MPRIGPISRREFIRCLRTLRFEGPYSGGKHQFMSKGDLVLRVPNPHQGDISMELLIRILRQSDIDRDIWEQL